MTASPSPVPAGGAGGAGGATPHASTGLDRTTAVVVALLFVVAGVSFVSADTLLAPAFAEALYVGDAPPAPPSDGVLGAAAFLALVAGVAGVAIAVLLLPVLRPASGRWAVGYVAFRVVELAAVLVYAAVPLALLALREDGRSSGGTEVLALLSAQRDGAFTLISLVAALAGVCLVAALHRAGLVRGPLLVLGYVAYPGSLAVSALIVLSISASASAESLLSWLALGAFELALAARLLAHGLRRPSSGGTMAEST